MNVARYVRISLFVLSVGVGGTVYIVKAADGFSSLNTKLYDVELEDATGLYVNSQVLMAGVPVGKIRKVELNDGRARLRVAFFKDVEIRSDAYISKQASSLLGTSILALSPGTPETPIVPAGALIQSSPAAGDFKSALAAAGDLSARMMEILDDFQKRHLELLAVSLETVNALGGKLNARSDAEFDRVSRILESTALIAERLERISGDRESDLEASLSEARAALANIAAVSAGIRNGEGTVGKAFTDEELYRRLLAIAAETEEASRSLNAALKSVDRLAMNADKVVAEAGDIVTKANGLGVLVDARSDYELIGSRAVSGAAITLEPRTGDRWYRIGFSGAPDGIKSTTTSASGGTETTTVTRKSGYYFQAELARVVGPLTLRGGVYENTAGIGMDLKPIPQLSLSAEAFDFSSEYGVPNLRAYLTVYPFFDPYGDKPWNWLFLRGGVRAALSENRDYFLGMGLRFADDEARGLVGLAALGN